MNSRRDQLDNHSCKERPESTPKKNIHQPGQSIYAIASLLQPIPQARFLFPFAPLTTPPFPQRPPPRPLDRSRNPLSAHLGKPTPARGLRRDAWERAGCFRSVMLANGEPYQPVAGGGDLACSWRDGFGGGDGTHGRDAGLRWEGVPNPWAW